MLGLRARDPSTRAKFTELYNRAVPASLYHRLEFIVMLQDWEPPVWQLLAQTGSGASSLSVRGSVACMLCLAWPRPKPCIAE